MVGGSSELSSQEVADGRCDLAGVGVEREMPRVEEPDFGVAVVALESLRTGRQEERVVPAPHGEQRRLAGTEVLLEFRIQRDVAGVVEEQVELDLVVARAG